VEEYYWELLKYLESHWGGPDSPLPPIASSVHAKRIEDFFDYMPAAFHDHLCAEEYVKLLGGILRE